MFPQEPELRKNYTVGLTVPITDKSPDILYLQVLEYALKLRQTISFETSFRPVPQNQCSENHIVFRGFQESVMVIRATTPEAINISLYIFFFSVFVNAYVY